MSLYIYIYIYIKLRLGSREASRLSRPAAIPPSRKEAPEGDRGGLYYLYVCIYIYIYIIYIYIYTYV